MSLPTGRLRSRQARLEGTRRGVRTLRVPRRIADDPGAVARFIAEERDRTGWRGRVALIAVPAPPERRRRNGACATVPDRAPLDPSAEAFGGQKG